MSSRPAEQLWLPFVKRGELTRAETTTESPPEDEQLMERVVERDNLIRALKKVKRNGGSPGVDGMTVDELAPYLKENWLRLKETLVKGTYRPQPVKRVEIPKPGGGVRKLGIPSVADRFVQQAIMQVLQKEWDPTFSDRSFGFRPGRSAHQAVESAQQIMRKGRTWVVDLDLEKFFDRVNHDKLMDEVAARVRDRRILRIIRRFLEAGVLEREAKSGRPFFAYVALTQPHLPTLPNPAFVGKTGNGDWADMLAEMDANVGQILDAVDKAGVRDNTIFIFTSDNGAEFFRPWDGWAGPWRGAYFTAL